MDWGDAIISSITKVAAGAVTTMDADLHLAGDFKATNKKATWLSRATPACAYARVCLLNYDYLITDAKLEKDDNVADIANPNTESVVDAPADANVLSFRLVYE